MTFPRFQIEQGNELSEMLQDSPFKIKKAFTEEGDFSNLFSGEFNIFIEKVIHKASIKVDESGAKCSAATAVVMKLSARNTVSFVVNSPFTFVLSDEPSKTILSRKVNKL